MHMDDGTIGLNSEQRSDFALREIFVEAYDLVVPFLNPDGTWVSQAHELQAYEAIGEHFPDIAGMRLFAVIGSIAGVRASGRAPVN